MRISPFQKILGILFWLSLAGIIYSFRNPADTAITLKVMEFTPYDFWAVPVTSPEGILREAQMKIQVNTYGDGCEIVNRNGKITVNGKYSIGPFIITSGIVLGKILPHTMAECR